MPAVAVSQHSSRGCVGPWAHALHLEKRVTESGLSAERPPPAAPFLPNKQLVVQAGHDPSTRPDGPLALILVPTRELAQQVWRVCRDLRTHSGLRACCIHGGVDKEEQVAALSKKVCCRRRAMPAEGK